MKPADHTPRALSESALGDVFPGPFRTSPHQQEAQRRATAWAQRFQLTDRPAITSSCAQASAVILPDADLDAVALSVDLAVWLVAFDDRHVEVDDAQVDDAQAAAAQAAAALSRLLAEFVTVMNSGTGAPAAERSPFAAALHDLLARFRARSTASQYAHLTASLRDSFLAMVWDAHHGRRPAEVTLADYSAMRSYTILARPFMVVARIAAAHDPSQDLLDSPRFRRLEDEAATLCGWINDLVSYHREIARGHGDVLALQTILARDTGGDLEAASALAADHTRRKALHVRHLLDELASGADPHPEHASLIEHVVRGAVQQITYARYATRS
ncbi:terpene synthase family protein [Chondromyces apiculatus]|uniref:Terpene synthase, metal-binding domain protein n=1 Tax=Chondromyces apiculatus DSM 436 TaxID=1192034 RepID=A0A017SZ17_9BACT|nr:hypothetical protein [Chondromyces apiculatus]EYF02234.1 Terpene synthase, metal-binding domain protein [Chondromyces apiculatus DSM 436]